MTGSQLDGRGGGAYGARVAANALTSVNNPAAASPFRERRRRLPSPEEQARRVAWGHTYGPLVGRMIRQSIARAES